MQIQEITLQSRNIQAQKQFYQDVLGFEIIQRTENCFSFRTQQTTIIFEQNINSSPYHFAFNIPSFAEQKAFDWLQKRVEILDYDGQKIIDFSAWNAMAMYFYDADGNIVEFIARRSLEIPMEGDFSTKSIYSLSEVGIPLNDIQQFYTSINKIMPLSIYDGGFGRFCAIGDEKGLFIVIDKNQKDWFPKADTAYSITFKAKIINGGKKYAIKVQNSSIQFLTS